jgi:hypothetical protein
MVLAGIKVIDTRMVHDAIELARSSSEPYLFNHAMRSWLFGVLLAEGAKPAPDPELLAVSAILHDLGLTDRYSALERFEVDGANAAGSFLKERGIPAHQIQLVWDALAADLIDPDLRLARRRGGGFLDHSGAGPRSGRLDRVHRKKPHNYLCNSRARRSFLRGERSFGTLP